ncbi:MAG: hypothetical protein KDC42_05105 [Ignavibacteriae bacterium]|nr:hypothetical protein [Ignavibacteriota bacterium]
MKNYSYLVLTLLFVVMISACSTVKITNKNLGGNWNIVFTGDLTGLGSFYINGSTNKFSSGNISLTNVELGEYDDYQIYGEISTNVITKGYIRHSGDTLGTLDGTFTIDAGAGSYVLNDSLQGGWTASKK